LRDRPDLKVPLDEMACLVTRVWLDSPDRREIPDFPEETDSRANQEMMAPQDSKENPAEDATDKREIEELPDFQDPSQSEETKETVAYLA